jgi:EAL and modified HD-GYP domain-containing signal transduction protein
MDVFVARQPILTQQRTVHGYELLFRSGLANVFHHDDPTSATLQVIDNSYFVFGLNDLIGGTRAFINFNHDCLINGYAELIPRQSLVVEVLEDVDPDDRILAACRNLKAAGYTIALDDFAGSEKQQALFPIADVIKVDLPQLCPDEFCSLPKRMARPGLVFLAEKVETMEEFELAARAGYTYFQGYFFAKPNLVAGVKPVGLKLNHLQILEQIQRPSIDLVGLETMIKRDMPLVYKILRYINSAGVGLRHPVRSVRQALLMLGEEGIRKYVSLMVLADLRPDKPAELVRMSAVRGSFCEVVAKASVWADRAHELFLMGLFSLIDAVMDRPLAEILKELPLPDDVVHALEGKNTPLRALYDLMIACEHADWDTIDRCAEQLGVSSAQVAATYRASLEWAQSTLG